MGRVESKIEAAHSFSGYRSSVTFNPQIVSDNRGMHWLDWDGDSGIMARSALLLLVVPLSLPAPAQQGPDKQNPASLQISGSVMVNRRPVSQATSTILRGDRIETSNSSAARVSAPGLSAYVNANSCLTYNGDQLDVCNCGSIDINALKQVWVRFPDREIVVTTQERNSAFNMNASGRDLKVSTRQGTTEVDRAGLVLTKVLAGTSKSFPGLGCTIAASVVPPTSVGAAAATAPGMIAATVNSNSSQRRTISSVGP